jgi:hypothetical protein
MSSVVTLRHNIVRYAHLTRTCAHGARAMCAQRRGDPSLTSLAGEQGGEAASLRSVVHLEAATVPALGPPDADPAAQEVRDPLSAAATGRRRCRG